MIELSSDPFSYSSITAITNEALEYSSTSNPPPIEVFRQDVVDMPAESEEKQGFWSKLFNWFWASDKKTGKELSFWDRLVTWFWGKTKEAEKAALDKQNTSSETIPYVPVLDAPEKPLPPLHASSNNNTTGIREIGEILDSLSDKTLQTIVALVMEKEFELEKEQTAVNHQLFSTYDRFEKLKEQTLEKVKDAILQDQNWAAKLKTPLQLTAAAVFICSMAVAAITFNFAVPIGVGVSAIFGQAVGSLFQTSLHALSTVAPIVGVLFAAFKGVSAYNELRLDSDTASLILVGHDEKFYKRLREWVFGNVETLSEKEAHYQEWFAKFQQRSQAMMSLLLKR